MMLYIHHCSSCCGSPTCRSLTCFWIPGLRYGIIKFLQIAQCCQGSHSARCPPCRYYCECRAAFHIASHLNMCLPAARLLLHSRPTFWLEAGAWSHRAGRHTGGAGPQPHLDVFPGDAHGHRRGRLQQGRSPSGELERRRPGACWLLQRGSWPCCW